MRKQPQAASFPAVNLMTQRERIRTGRRPVVRMRFWVVLATSVLALIVIMGIQLLPTLVVQR